MENLQDQLQSLLQWQPVARGKHQPLPDDVQSLCAVRSLKAIVTSLATYC